MDPIFGLCTIMIVSGFGAGLLTGCMAYRAAVGSPAADTTQVQIGSTRTEVEALLGRPVGTDRNLHTYEYNTESFPHGSDPGDGHLGAAALILIVDIASLGIFEPSFQKEYRSQRARILIAYGPDDRVVGISRSSISPSFETDYIYWLTHEYSEKSLAALCRSSNSGYAPAQFAQAVRFRYGVWGTEPDTATALLWAKLALFGGSKVAENLIVQWSEGIGDDKASAIDQAFKTWKPADCDR